MKNKQQLLDEFEARKVLAKERGQLRNENLIAGADMFYYCKHCGLLSDRVPECWDPRSMQPSRECLECKSALEAGVELS